MPSIQSILAVLRDRYFLAPEESYLLLAAIAGTKRETVLRWANGTRQPPAMLSRLWETLEASPPPRDTLIRWLNETPARRESTRQRLLAKL